MDNLLHFVIRTNDGSAIHRTDTFLYVAKLVIAAIRRGDTVRIEYADGSSNEINPKE